MSMKRYSTDSCSVQYFEPYQQYKYVPNCSPECLPEYENWSQCGPSVETYLFPQDMPNPFFEAVQQQSWTDPDLEQNTSDWQMCNNHDNHGVARTSAGANKHAVGYSTEANARRRRNSLPRARSSSPSTKRTNNDEFRAARAANDWKKIQNGITPSKSLWKDVAGKVKSMRR